MTGLLLSVVAVIIWLVWPARKDSRWKLQGAFGKGDGRTVAQMRADAADTKDERMSALLAQVQTAARGHLPRACSRR